MILEKIKQANIQAMKDKDKVARSFFSVLLNKINLLEISKRQSGQPVSEADVVSVLQKQAKELADEKENYKKVNNLSAIAEVEKQEEIVASFLPEMLSEKEIEDIISKMLDKSLPAVMRFFKEKYAGKVDMRLVNQIARKF